MEVGVGIIGLGNVGGGTLQILTENARSIEEKLGFPLRVKVVCSRSVHKKSLALDGTVLLTTDWRDVVADPEVDIVAEPGGWLGRCGRDHPGDRLPGTEVRG